MIRKTRFFSNKWIRLCCFIIVFAILVMIVTFQGGRFNKVPLYNRYYVETVRHESHTLSEPTPSNGTMAVTNSKAETTTDKAKDPRCLNRQGTDYKEVEDIFCIQLPPFEPRLKNPCFYENLKGSSRRVLRCLPFFYLIGTDKCATTDLFNRLSSHPDVRDNLGKMRKETWYWTWNRFGTSRMKMKQYFGYFNETRTELEKGAQNNSSNNVITGDASPMNFFRLQVWRQIPQNWGKPEPEVLTPHEIKFIHGDRQPKLLLQLREPVDRLYSDYVFGGHKDDVRRFHDHVMRAINLTDECIHKYSQRHCFIESTLFSKLPVRLPLSCYSVYLKEWLAVFPRSSIHVTRMEDFRDDMNTTLRGIFSFLGLKQISEQDMEAITSMGRKFVTKNKKRTVLPETYRVLKEYYRPCSQETASLLNDTKFLWDDVYSKTMMNENKDKQI